MSLDSDCRCPTAVLLVYVAHTAVIRRFLRTEKLFGRDLGRWRFAAHRVSDDLPLRHITNLCTTLDFFHDYSRKFGEERNTIRCLRHI